jgi:hypothetical protein
MKPEQRIVTQFPLRELWTSRGQLAAERGRALGASDLAVSLQERPILGGARFAIADVGHPLRWLDAGEFLDFWEREARGRIVSPEQARFRLDDYSGEYCFTVHEWHDAESEMPILVFERHH